jgi:hypothetical protein
MQVFGLQWDSASGDIPAEAKLRALYVNGGFATRPVHYGRGRVWIDVVGNAPDKALWLDVERFDATPAAVPGWLDARRKSGAGTGGIYCDRSALPAVESAAGGRPHMLWVATLDGTVDIGRVPGVGRLVAVQAFPASMTGRNADLSIVVDEPYWLARALP